MSLPFNSPKHYHNQKLAEENKKNLKDPDFSKFSNVLILKIEGVGNYAIRIIFDDGHNTGIYSWEYLHEIGLKILNSTTP